MGRILSREGEKVMFTKFKEFVTTRSLIKRNSSRKTSCEIPEAQRKLNFLISEFCCEMCLTKVKKKKELLFKLCV